MADPPLDEDDYMAMTIPNPQLTSKNESFSQRRKRLQREAEARSRPKSKAELAAEAQQAHQQGLATKIDGGSKGAKMMAKLGYQPGSALGAQGNANARAEPIGVEMREGREGIGALSEKKRKFMEEADKVEQGEKRRKEDEGDYRERVAREREEKRMEGMWWGAMKVLEGMEEGEGSVEDTDALGATGLPIEDEAQQQDDEVKVSKRSLLYKPLVLDRREKEQEKRRRYDLMQSLSRNVTYDDPQEDAHDRQALGNEVEDIDEDDDLDENLKDYMATPIHERLGRVVTCLKDHWCYCFYCKYKYRDKDEMDNECPGLTEDEHG